MSRARRNRKVETMPRSALERIQARGLRRLLRRVAEHSPMYGEHLRANGVHAEAIRTVRDFQRGVPPVSKDDLRRHMEQHGDPLPHLCVPRDQVTLVGMSTGTSGRRTFDAYTRRDVLAQTEIIARHQAMVGFRSSDVLYFPATAHSAWAVLADNAARALGMRLVLRDAIEPRFAERYLYALRWMKPTVAYLGLSVVRAIEEVASQQGLVPRDLVRLRRIITYGDRLSPEARAVVRDRWGVDCHVLGGSGSDITVFGVECDLHDGLHFLCEDKVLVEVIDPDSLEPCPPGETGELVLTDFYRQATPHVRLRTGDLARVLPGPTCECGRTHLRVDFVGRAAFTVTVNGKQVRVEDVERALSGVGGLTNHEFSIVRSASDMSRLVVRVRVALAGDGSVNETMRRTAQAELERVVGQPATVELVGDLPVVGYKTLRVVDA